MVIKVPIIVSYNNKGTKQAVKGIGGLEKSFKKMGLASKLSFAAAGIAVTAFTKKAVTAALEESKAVAVLNNQLKNLGLGFAAVGVNAYIDNLQRATAVSEDQLRPAFSSLIRATSDLGKAQQLLALTLDISASTGFGVEQVSKSLSKAYLGQNTALGKLGVGLTKVELKTLNFEQIQKRLTILFKGGAAAAVDTYAGSVAKLQIAAKEASETIGFALIDGIKRLGDENGIDDAADSMEKLASQTAFAITGFSVLSDTISNSALGKGFGSLLQFGPVAMAINELARLGKATIASENTGTNRQSPRATEKAAEKAAAKAIKNAKQKLSLEKQTAALKKLQAKFDLDNIQLSAALAGKLSKEDEARVRALQALKTEQKADDLKTLEELEALQKKSADAEVARQNEILATHKRNAAEILAVNKDNAKTYADFVKSFTYPGGLFSGTPLANSGNNATDAKPAPSMSAPIPNFQDFVNNEMAIDAPFMPGDPGYSGTAGQNRPAPNLTVNLQGGINVGSTFEFYQTVQTALQELNRAGNSLTPAGN